MLSTTSSTRAALRCVIVLIDVTFSTSLVEAWWRTLEHQWLYLHKLDNVATVGMLLALFVTQHDQTMPHSAFSRPDSR